MNLKLSEDRGDMSTCTPILDARGESDVTDPSSPSTTVRPSKLLLTLYPNGQTWEAQSATVFGPKVRAQVLTKRDYPVSFSLPLGEDSEAPDWVREAAAEWVARLNGLV